MILTMLIVLLYIILIMLKSILSKEWCYLFLWAVHLWHCKETAREDHNWFQKQHRCRDEHFCEYSYQLEKRNHQQFHNCGWQDKQKDEHCHRLKQKQIHQASQTCFKRLFELGEISQSYPIYIKRRYNLLLHKYKKGW